MAKVLFNKTPPVSKGGGMEGEIYVQEEEKKIQQVYPKKVVIKYEKD